MAIDPAVFADHEQALGIKFPDRGTPILVKTRTGTMIAGNVERVWLAMDIVVINVETIHGIQKIYPEFGDKFITEVT